MLHGSQDPLTLGKLELAGDALARRVTAYGPSVSKKKQRYDDGAAHEQAARADIRRLSVVAVAADSSRSAARGAGI